MSKSSDFDKRINRYIIDRIECNDTDKEKIEFLERIFISDYGWAIRKIGRQKAVEEWLKGLPSILSIPFYNSDRLLLAFSFGRLNVGATEAQENKFINQYWTMISAKIVQLFNNPDKDYKLKGDL